MQISPVNNYPGRTYETKNTSFKSVYPVYVWLAEKNGKYAATTTYELTKTLNSKLVRILNKFRWTPSSSAEQAELRRSRKALFFKPDNNGKIEINPQKIADYIGDKDSSYKQIPVVRSFYDPEGGSVVNGKMKPLVYWVTGDEVKFFNEEYAMEVGRKKKTAPIINNKRKSAELNQALGDYYNKGLYYVTKRSKEFVKEGMPNGLHIKMQTLRSKTGNIKGYDITAIGFLPEIGKDNPFVKMGYYK